MVYAGVTLEKQELERIAEMTAAASAWLVIDNTYESFLFSGAKHYTLNAPNIVHVFSFSKANFHVALHTFMYLFNIFGLFAFI